MARSRVRSAMHTRSGYGDGVTHWTSPGTDEKGKGYLNCTNLTPGESRKVEDWELPCCVTSFLAIVILGVWGLNKKPDLTIETWSHEKVPERLREKEMATAGESE